MATLPPPYTQREARQAQRDYQRALRRPSLVGPVVLIAAGILALLVETNYLSGQRLWDWYMRWWPLLLIGVGALSLGEWWLGRNAGPGRAPSGGAHVGWILLILALAGIGHVAGFTNRSLHNLHVFGHGEEDDFFSRMMGEEHHDDRSLNEAIPDGAVVEILVPHGDVTVTQSGDSQLHVQAHLVVYTGNDKDARRGFDALAPQATVNGNSVTLRVADSKDGRADLTVEIPKGALPRITARQGDVTLEGLGSAVDATVDRGDLKADHLASSLHVHSGKGDLSAHAIAGDVALEGRFDDVSISEVQGRVTLNGDFFGDTNLARIAAPVHFHSSRTDLEAMSVPGDLSIDSGDLQLNNAAGPIKISTSAKDVECSAITGDLHVEDGDGDITAGVIAPLGQLQLHNRNGAIHLTVPTSAGFQLLASAQNGDIDAQLGLPVQEAGEGKTISGKIGTGGPTFSVTSEHGDIEISRIDMSAAPPALPSLPRIPPLPPLAPLPGGKAMRHLHTAKPTQPPPQPVEQ